MNDEKLNLNERVLTIIKYMIDNNFSLFLQDNIDVLKYRSNFEEFINSYINNLNEKEAKQLLLKSLLQLQNNMDELCELGSYIKLNNVI